MLNIIFEHKILFFVILAIILINVVCLIVYIIKERQADKKEIEGIVNELMDAKPRENSVHSVIENNDESIQKQNENSSKKADISSMLSEMKRDLEEKNSEDIVADFEAEQEEKSIISYQELVNSLKEKNKVQLTKNTENIPVIEIDEKSDVPVIDVDDKNDIPVIEIEEENVESLKEMIKDKENFNGENVVKKKFKTTEFISPIYGKMEDTSEYPVIKANKHEMKIDDNIDSRISRESKYHSNVSLEESLDLEPLSDEIKKNDEFLNALKDFRKNLE